MNENDTYQACNKLIKVILVAVVLFGLAAILATLNLNLTEIIRTFAR